MFTIITPCSRKENLHTLYNSIQFEYIHNWIIVYDSSIEFDKTFDHPKILEYFHHSDGISGNAQRNYGLTKVKSEGFIYFLDDDNVIHPDFWNTTFEPEKIYTFNQEHQGTVRLKGNKIKVGRIDTAMFLVYSTLIKGTTWNIHNYTADGEFIRECYLKNRRVWIYLDKILCYYNKINE